MNTGVLNVAVWHCCDSSDHVGLADEDTEYQAGRVCYCHVSTYRPSEQRRFLSTHFIGQ